MTTFFSTLPSVASDPILKTVSAYKRDPSPLKINLSIGVYQDEQGKTPMLKSVRLASESWLNQEESKEYLPAEGLDTFLKVSGELFFGRPLTDKELSKIAAMQTVGGSGALRLAADLYKEYSSDQPIYVSNPTWDNHHFIFERAGLEVKSYPYYDLANQKLDLEKLLEKFNTLPKNSFVLLHAACHNPTGVDPSQSEWDQILEVIRERELLPLVDSAYQGFSTSKTEDTYIARKLLEMNIPFVVAYSFSKSFSMYRERVGALFIVTQSDSEATIVRSRLVRLARTNYSRPPSWGAQVVNKIASTPEFFKMWQQELAEMRGRTSVMRSHLTQLLKTRLPNSNLAALENGQGLFSLLDVTPASVLELQEKRHIYMLESGRVCIAALRPSTLEYVADSLCEVIGK